MLNLNRTIKSRLISTAIGITIILLAIGVFTNISIKKAFHQYTLLNTVDKLTEYRLKLRQAEKNFLLKETVNPKFFETGGSVYLEEFTSTKEMVDAEITYLMNEDAVSDMEMLRHVSLIKSGFENYERNFLKLTSYTKVKGFKDYGVIGEMRDQIHLVEDIVEANNNLLYTKYMLTLRRHEKDYLLRRDLKYQDRFENVIADFIAALKKDHIEVSRAKRLISALETYEQLFNKVIQQDVLIGFDEKSGINKRLTENTSLIESNLAIVRSGIYDKATDAIQKAILNLFIIIGLLSTLIVVILFRDTRHIVSSLRRLQKYISRLGKGELPEEIKIKGTDEIADMKSSINVLTRNLKNTRDFAIEVGNGNFEQDINVFDNKGDLGGHLIEMRNKLLQVAKEQEEHRIDAERRSWANEGIAMITDLLRTHQDSLEELGYQLVAKLSKYMKVNQGGLFLKTNEDGKEYYDMLAAFAFDRRKFANKRIARGEGLVGTCASEKDTVFMTEVPQTYVEITSGLGGATPNCILIEPLIRDEEVLGVIEFASFHVLEEYEQKFIKRAAEVIAGNIFTLEMNLKTRELLEKTQKQKQQMQEQEEELKQNMEELQATQERLAHQEAHLKKSLLDEKKKVKDLSLEYHQVQHELSNKSTELESLLKGLNKSLLVAEYDLQGKLLRENKRHHEVLGKEASGNVFSNIPEEFMNRFRAIWDDIRKGDTYKGNLILLDRDNHEIYLGTSLIPVLDENKRVKRILYISNIGQDNKKLSKNGSNMVVHKFINAERIICNDDWDQQINWLS